MTEVLDIECLSNLFTYTGYCRQTKEYSVYIIHKLQNDYVDLIEHLKNKQLILVGYNIDNYDYPILFHMINHYDEYSDLDGYELSQKIYEKSQEIISMDFSSIADWKKYHIVIDLFKIWHFDSKALSTSLKSLEISMNLPNVEDMPFDHTYWVTTWDEINQILSYNKNDVFATNEFLNVTLGDTKLELYKGKNKIQLRQDIYNEYGINCLNYNDVKIGEEINKIEYLNNNPWLKSKDLKSLVPNSIPSFTFGQCIPNYVIFKTKEFNNFRKSIENITVDIISNDEKKQTFPFIYNMTKYTIARGGIHSCEKGRILIPKDNECLRDADVGSQYPNAIRKRKLYPRHLGESWLIGYTKNIEKRIEAKHLGKKTKEARFDSIAETLKLSLNGGGFGKSGESNNWQYDPFLSFSCTIGNQFEILMLIESMELSGIHVVSANTDGIVCLFDKSLENEYYKNCHNWEKIVGNETLGQLEFTDYSKMVQYSVNDYLAVKNNGQIKLKGDFCIDRELHKNPSMKIVPIALKEYFVNNIPIMTTLKSHKNIYDFCLRLKIVSGFKGIYRYIGPEGKVIDKLLSKNIRYFISNSGGILLKEKNNSFTGVNVGNVVTLFNQYYELPMEEYNINYDFYLRECNKIINIVEESQYSPLLF
jgi:hypothetical protein